ncbi:transmembrane channel-like protein 6 isoform X2 [Perognathus longimembris pacificus]|uniref:transmembrane channel-like protein 6 isoform X2 n=1 Tax=Perognathus longimembris pacificus TaxID=214514 RepID=UPI00201884BF|nr:transmembrane channel-like protein 6 isoform X2 [Perognathus longimembris pacificus]
MVACFVRWAVGGPGGCSSAADPPLVWTARMAQPLALVLHVPETEGDQDREPSPHEEESEVHDSFHRLIQEQSLRAAEEGLELQPVASTPGDPGHAHQTPLGPDGGPVYSAATLRVLASMPSRTIGRSRGAIISQYYNRTVRQRHRNSRPLLGNVARSAHPSRRLYDLELDPASLQEDEKRSLLVKELQGLSAVQRDHTLRAMPLSLAEKRWLREKSWSARGRRRAQQGRGVSCWSRLWYAWILTLLAFNALLLLPLLAFTVGVQAAFPPAPPDPPGPAASCTGLELLTGGGCFTHTVMYYGYYSNATLSQPCAPAQDGSPCGPRAGGLPYSMPLAYLFTIGAAFFITCITLVYSMSRSFGESYRVGSTKGIHALTVFCSWDYKVTQKWAARVQQDGIRTQLKELLAEWRQSRSPRRACGRAWRGLVLGLVWLLCLGATLGCAVAVLAFSEVTMQSPVTGSQEARLLALPLVASLLNLGAPYLFRGLATLERHESPVLQVYVAICRNLLLKMAVLAVLCYHWLGRRAAALQGRCWEDFVGQELYRFTVMDFFFTLLDTLFGELVWRLISEKKLNRKPEFDIARNVLDLIYGQTLIWLGVLFSPLLPAVQILRLLLLFYVKKASLMANCQAPRRAWLAARMRTVFLTLLCFPAFLGAAVFLSYAVWQVKPSGSCGPFRTLNTMYEAGTAWVHRLEQAGPGASWLPWLHQHLVENPLFTFLVSALLLAVIYLNIQVVKGQREVICLLKEQIRNEGEDKVFLINKLHSVYEKSKRSRVGGSQGAAASPAQLADGEDAWGGSERQCQLAWHPHSAPDATALQAPART